MIWLIPVRHLITPALGFFVPVDKGKTSHHHFSPVHKMKGHLSIYVNNHLLNDSVPPLRRECHLKLFQLPVKSFQGFPLFSPRAFWSAIIKVESENSPKYGRIGRHRKVRKMATYEKSFKEEAVKLSDEIGIKKAAAQLGVPYYTLADWRHRQNIHGDQAHVGSGHKRETGDEKDRRIRELERENAELARANEILQEALGFFAKNRKK